MLSQQLGFACLLTHVALVLSGASDEDKSGLSTFRKLRKHLLTGYDVNARPVSHHDNTTEVEVDISPIHITSLNEETAILTLEGWLAMSWDDDHLKWDPANFSGLDILRLPDTEVWKPDLATYNGRGSKSSPWSSVQVLLLSSGKVTWIPPASLQFICGISDYRGYPQDTQECTLTLGSWTTDANNLDLKIGTENVSLADFFNAANPHWELLSVRGKRKVKIYDCCAEPYVSLDYTMKLRRTNVPFAALQSTSDTVARVLVLCMFWVTGGTRKLVIGCTSLLVLATIAVGITVTLPSPAAAPAALLQVNSALCICVSALVVEILVMALSSFRIGSPAFLESLASSGLCQLLSPCHHEAYSAELMEATAGQKAHRWAFLATLVDRAAFVIFSVLLLAL